MTATKAEKGRRRKNTEAKRKPTPAPTCSRCQSNGNVVPATNYGRESGGWWCRGCGTRVGPFDPDFAPAPVCSCACRCHATPARPHGRTEAEHQKRLERNRKQSPEREAAIRSALSTPAPVAEVSAAKHELPVLHVYEGENFTLIVEPKFLEKDHPYHEGVLLTMSTDWGQPHAPAVALASEIVRRCNAFPDVVAALERHRAHLETEIRMLNEEARCPRCDATDEHDESCYIHALQYLHEDARAALAKAGK